MELLALGELRVQNSLGLIELGGPRQRRLLTVLLIHRHAGATVDRLADAVFGDAAVEHPEAALRTYVARLRKAINGHDSSLVLRTDIGYRLAVSDEQVDVARFERLVDLGRRQYGYGDARTAVETLGRADALWRGRPFDEFADEPWASSEASRVQAVRSSARETLVDAFMACGRGSDAVALAQNLVDESPFSEAAAARLMLALYRSGRPSDALASFADYRRRAADELGLDPGVELVELQRRVLDRDPTLDISQDEGRTLRGYRVTEPLGVGADGTVFSAQMRATDRSYALRVYRDDVANDPDVASQFDAQVRMLIEVAHPAIVPIVDGWREPSVAVLVMRRLSGGTLDDRMANGTLSRSDAIAALRRVGAALVSLHQRGLSHGRVRASSVLYDDHGDAYLSEPLVGGRLAPGTHGADAEQFVRLASMCWQRSRPAHPDEPAPWEAGDVPPPTDDVVSAVTAVLAAVDRAFVPVLNPYVGLRPFDAADSRVFFGRDDFVTVLQRRVAATSPGSHLTVLVGGSGSGKSSVVRAGLVPRLRAGADASWVVATMTPGERPFESLRHALAGVVSDGDAAVDGDLTDPRFLTDVLVRLVPGGTRLLLVVDQFEELFTLAPTGERERFLDVLAELSSREDAAAHVLATIRADYFDRPLDHPWFGARVGRAAMPIPAMTPSQLEQAVTGPAGAAGRSLESGLVSELVTAVSHRPAALPALQFTLHELAERCDGPLTWAALDALGGVDGAIAARAEELYGAMSSSAQAIVRRVLERLVVVPEAGEPTRRRVPRADLVRLAGDPAVAEDVLETWISARLLAGDRQPDTREPTVEIAHEAVLTRWPRLAAWIDASRERLLALARLRDDAATWQELGRDDAALLRGARLEHALEITKGEAPVTSAPLDDYIAAGVAQRNREDRAREEAAASRVRTTRRLRVQRTLLAAALVLALGVGGLAIDQRGRAARNAAAADARAQAATAGLVAASDTATASDWSLALLLAAEAYRIDDSPQTRRGLAAAITNPAPIPSVLREGDSPHDTVAIDDDRGTVAVKSPDGQVDVLTLDGGDLIAGGLGGIPRTGGGALDLADGLLATGGNDADGGRALVYRTEDQALVAEIRRDVAVTDLAFSPDGQQLAVAGAGGRIDVYAVDGWSVTSTPIASGVRFVESVAWGNDGSWLYAGGGSGSVYAWDMSSLPDDKAGEDAPVPNVVTTLDESGTLGSAVGAIVPVPESSLLVLGQADADSYLADAQSLEIVAGPVPHRAWGAAVDPDGRLVALAQQTSLTLIPLPGPGEDELGEPVTLAREADDVVFTRDGTLISVGSGGTVVRWEVDPALPGLEEIPGLAPGLPTFSPDGSLLAMWGNGSGVRLFDAATYEPVSTLALPDAATIDMLGIAFQPERDRVVVSYCPQPPASDADPCQAVVAAFNTTTGRQVVPPVTQGPVLSFTTSSVRASDTADVVATGEVGGRVTIRDPDTLEPVSTLDDIVGSVASDRAWLRISDDGTLLMASVTPTNRLAVWDLTSSPPALLRSQSTAGINFFTPQGDVVTGNDGGQMSIIDPRTGETIYRTDTSPIIARASFTSDGAWLGASDFNRDAWLWSTEDWQPVAGPINVSGFAWDAVHPAGTHLLVNGDTVYAFPLDAQTWYELACDAAGRNLTDAEWQRHFADEPYRETCPGAKDDEDAQFTGIGSATGAD